MGATKRTTNVRLGTASVILFKLIDGRVCKTKRRSPVYSIVSGYCLNEWHETD